MIQSFFLTNLLFFFFKKKKSGRSGDAKYGLLHGNI